MVVALGTNMVASHFLEKKIEIEGGKNVW